MPRWRAGNSSGAEKRASRPPATPSKARIHGRASRAVSSRAPRAKAKTRYEIRSRSGAARWHRSKACWPGRARPRPRANFGPSVRARPSPRYVHTPRQARGRALKPAGKNKTARRFGRARPAWPPLPLRKRSASALHSATGAASRRKANLVGQLVGKKNRLQPAPAACRQNPRRLSPPRRSHVYTHAIASVYTTPRGAAALRSRGPRKPPGRSQRRPSSATTTEKAAALRNARPRDLRAAAGRCYSHEATPPGTGPRRPRTHTARPARHCAKRGPPTNTKSNEVTAHATLAR